MNDLKEDNMKAPVCPYPHNFGVPRWALTQDFTEEISVVVGGEGPPADARDLGGDLDFCDSRQEQLLNFIHGKGEL